MKTSAVIVQRVFHFLTRVLFRMDIEQVSKIPAQGPLILVVNHINFLDVPLMVTMLHPRPLTGFAKSESWKIPGYNLLFDMWEAIPIDRGVVDRAAFQKGLDALSQGKIVAIAPEGTRSGSGELQIGKPGAVLLALRSGAPVLPVAYYGSEHFWTNLKHLRRTDFHVRVGEPFTVQTNGAALDKETRQSISDEIMYRIASLLPDRYHGIYAGPEQVQYRYLKDSVSPKILSQPSPAD